MITELYTPKTTRPFAGKSRTFSVTRVAPFSILTAAIKQSANDKVIPFALKSRRINPAASAASASMSNHFKLPSNCLVNRVSFGRIPE